MTNERVFLIDLTKVALADLARIPIAVLGRFVKGKQKFAITKDDLATLVAHFRARKAAEAVIDYDHASEFPEVAQGNPIPAAGWLKTLEDGPDADGILWGQAEFTARAQKMIQEREYKYLSPVISWGARDKGTGEPLGATLLSMALTNRPFLEALPAIQLSDAWVADTTEAEQTERRIPMVKKVILADRAAATVRVIADDDTERVLTVEGLQPEPKVVRLSDVKRGADGQFDFAALQTGAEVLIAGEVFGAMQAQTALNDAIKAGKVLPAQRTHFEAMALSDLAGFRSLMTTMKPQVELTERGVAGTGEESNDLAAAEAQINQFAAEKQKAGVGYTQALKLVASEHPDLWRRRLELQQKKAKGE